ncbi:MAG: S-layer protein [Candidatus Micrarchaeia archaeon]
MKTLNAKRIAALVAGAALLGTGLAFAASTGVTASSPSGITFGGVTVITSSGVPNVQIVVGSNAKPMDAVSAGNIAAAIGNLAYTQQAVTAYINPAQAKSVLGVQGLPSQTTTTPTQTNSTVSLANATALFNVTGITYASGTYTFKGLIGSVLNRGIKNGNPSATKAVGSTITYGYPELNSSTTTSQVFSPYQNYVPVATASGSYNAGGVSFTQLTNNGVDNILRITNAQLPSLLSNSGAYGESETLWLTGFPVYDQNANNFALLSAGGAYQITFNRPINIYTSSNTVNTASFSLLGQNWTIIGANSLPTSTTGNIVAGGKLELASSLTPMVTVPLGGNLISSNIRVQLQGIGQPNSNGISPASVALYYGNSNVSTNTSIIWPGNIETFNVSGTLVHLEVNQTFAGITGLQYATMKLYSNVFNVTSGQKYNATLNPNWYTTLLWTNITSNGKGDKLYSIVLYNTNPTTLLPGQSTSFMTTPAKYSLSFIGPQSASYDPLSITTAYASPFAYENGNSATTWSTVSNITEPAQELVITSQIPNAFSFGSQQTSTLTYDLTPYTLAPNPAMNSYSTAISELTTANVIGASNTIVLTGTFNGVPAGMISSTAPLTVTVQGYNTQNTLSGATLTFNTGQTAGNYVANTIVSLPFVNVTSVELNNRAIPMNSLVLTENSPTNTNAVAVNLATLSMSPQTPELLYSQAGKSYQMLYPGASVQYNQQNGQSPTTFNIALNGLSNPYFTYTMQEYPVPSSLTYEDMLSFSLYNNTAGAQAEPMFILNESNGNNNMTYISTQGTSVKAGQGFVTERGSKIVQISPTSITLDMAKSPLNLMFAVGTSNNTAVSHQVHTVPVSVGQTLAAFGLPNVTLAKVTGSVPTAPTPAPTPVINYTITGINKIIAYPSINVSITPVHLTGLSSTAPLVILDNQTVASSPYIVVGSGYVNSLAAQVEKAENITVSPTMGNGKGYIVAAYPGNSSYGGRIYVAGYTAGDTLKAADYFINQLYAAAASQ